MPTPNKGEKERDYIARCVPKLIKEGKPHDQAVAVCYSMFDQHKKAMSNASGASNTARAFIFATDADSGDFRQALTLGQGYPKEINGEQCAYMWKELLRPRRFIDAAGVAHTIEPARINNLIANFKKLSAKGKMPSLLSRHPQENEPKDARYSFGDVLDVKTNDSGGLEGLCRFIGVDAIRASARNHASIGTALNVTDADGEQYDEILDHVAVVPDPRLTDLEGFKPAMAASNGPAVPAVVLSPAVVPVQTPTRSTTMPIDISPLRQALSLADTVAEAEVIAKAKDKITTDGAALTAAQTALAAEKKRADDADAKALQLSNSAGGQQPDTRMLSNQLVCFTDRLDALMERNKCTPEQKKAALEIVAPAGQPGLMLSQSISTGPASAILKLLELSATNPFGQHSSSQPVGRSTPGDSGVKNEPMSEARMKELLAETSLGRAILTGPAK